MISLAEILAAMPKERREEIEAMTKKEIADEYARRGVGVEAHGSIRDSVRLPKRVSAPMASPPREKKSKSKDKRQ